MGKTCAEKETDSQFLQRIALNFKMKEPETDLRMSMDTDHAEGLANQMDSNSWIMYLTNILLIVKTWDKTACGNIV